MALIETTIDPRVQTGRLIRDAFTGCANLMRMTMDNVEHLVWENPYGLAPQEVFDLLGPDAAQMVVYRETFLPMLQQVFGADQIVSKRPKDAALTVDPSGTVKVK
jgi:hypothetical protein